MRTLVKIQKKLADSIKEAVARGDIEIEVLGKNVVMNFTPTDAEQKICLNYYKKR